MANKLLIKRSAVADKVPTTTDLALGELGLNTNDGKLYLKRDNGTAAIVEVAVKDSSGNLGIGTAPSARLHLLSTTEQLRAAYDASNYVSVTVGSTGSTVFDAAGTGAAFRFADNVTVGSGTSPVDQKLNVRDGNIALQGTTTSATTSTGYITSHSDMNGSRYEVGRIDFQTGAFADAGQMLFSTKTGAGSLTERMRIDSSGNVGIGTTASARLHVVSTTEQLRAAYDASTYLSVTVGSNGFTSYNSTGGGALHYFAQQVRSAGGLATAVGSGELLLSTNGVLASIDMYSPSGALLLFKTSNTSGTVTERMRIDSAGNVGIGTSGPSNKLEVVQSSSGDIAKFFYGGGTKSPYIQIAADSDTGMRLVAGNSDSTNYFGITVAGAERLRITVNGGVSFGSTGTAYGTAGQVLTSAGDAVPTWSNPTTLGTSVATTSGTNKDFTIPAWARQVVVTLAGVSFATTAAALRIQLGDAGGIETSGYTGACAKHASTSAYSNLSGGFDMQGTYVVANTISGRIELTLVDAASFTWACHAVLGEGGTAQVWTISGHKALTEALTTVRVTSVAGTSAFDAGTVNVAYH